MQAWWQGPSQLFQGIASKNVDAKVFAVASCSCLLSAVISSIPWWGKRWSVSSSTEFLVTAPLTSITTSVSVNVCTGCAFFHISYTYSHLFFLNLHYFGCTCVLHMYSLFYSLCLSVFLSVSVCLFFFPFLSACLCLFFSVFVCLSVCLSFCLSIYVCLSLSVSLSCLSFSLSLSLFLFLSHLSLPLSHLILAHTHAHAFFIDVLAEVSQIFPQISSGEVWRDCFLCVRVCVCCCFKACLSFAVTKWHCFHFFNATWCRYLIAVSTIGMCVCLFVCLCVCVFVCDRMIKRKDYIFVYATAADSV